MGQPLKTILVHYLPPKLLPLIQVWENEKNVKIVLKNFPTMLCQSNLRQMEHHIPFLKWGNIRYFNKTILTSIHIDNPKNSLSNFKNLL